MESPVPLRCLVPGPLDTSISWLGTRPLGRMSYTAQRPSVGLGTWRVGVINAHVVEVKSVAASTLETELHSGAEADEVHIEA